jgi:carboxymethylenebutenolidase
MSPRRSGEDLKLTVEGGSLPAYRTLPPAGHGPGVLVLHEGFGLVDHIRDVCDRLGREGFVALAPDLYRGRHAEALEEAVELAGSLEPERTGRDLEGAIRALLDQHGVVGPCVGAIGFCMGGHLALLAASLSPRVGAAVDFYGFHSWLPIDFPRIEAAVLGIFAENDEFIPAELVETLRRDLDAADTRATFHVQAGVVHAFMNDSRPDRYDATAAAEGWARMLTFLRAELA